MVLHPEDAHLVAYLRQSTRILVFTGAGVSTESGIPDFRGPQGVWKKRKPVYYNDFLRSEEARLEHWDYKLEQWPYFSSAQPNASHYAAQQLLEAGKLECVVTQNIDGLHGKSGIPGDKLVEIHGSNAEIECTACQRHYPPEPIYKAFADKREPPLCPECNGFLKPATISFGQSLRMEDLRRAEEAAHSCDLVVALGSSLSVYPAASIPLIAAQRGAPYVVINRGETEHDHLPEVTLRLEGCVTEWFPPAVKAALEAHN